MKPVARHLALTALAAIALAGCSRMDAPPHQIDVPKPEGEGGSIEVGNPALKATNLALAVKIVQRPAVASAPQGEEPAVAGQFTLTWDPPSTPPAFYRVERKIGASGTSWALIATLPASVKEQIDYGELGATHHFRVWSCLGADDCGVSDEVSGRIPTFCDYPSGWSMVWPPHGCARFEGTFALDAATTYFSGSKLIVREDDGTHAATYETIDIGPDLVLKDVCAVDRDHVYAVGYAQAPREKAKGAAVAIVGGVVRRLDIAGLERGPLLRIFCESADRFFAVGSRGTALACGQASCAPIAGVDDPAQEKPYAAIWGVPSQSVITGATLDSLIAARPDGPSAPVALGRAAAEDRLAKDHAVVDILGRGNAGRGRMIRMVMPLLLLATDDGLYESNGMVLRKIDDGRWRRLWGMSEGNFYAAGEGIARFHVTPAGEFEKIIEGPPLAFTSLSASQSGLYLTDDTGQLFRGDGNGHYEFLFNIWRGGLPPPRPALGWKSPAQVITSVAAVSPGLLAISFSGTDDGLVLLSPADGSTRPVPELHRADVFAMTPVPGRILIASSIGLFAMDTGGAGAVTKLADGIFTSAWDCGEAGICAVGADVSPKLRQEPLPEAADAISLISPVAGAARRVIAAAPAGEQSRFRQAWGTPGGGLFAVAPRRAGDQRGDAIIAYGERRWNEEALPEPPAGTEEVRLRIVSSPARADAEGAAADRPVLLAKYARGKEATYALIAYRNGRWAEVDRGDHLRALAEITPTGERIMGVPEAPFETTSYAALSPDDLWAVADEKFLFRWTR